MPTSSYSSYYCTPPPPSFFFFLPLVSFASQFVHHGTGTGSRKQEAGSRADQGVNTTHPNRTKTKTTTIPAHPSPSSLPAVDNSSNNANPSILQLSSTHTPVSNPPCTAIARCCPRIGDFRMAPGIQELRLFWCASLIGRPKTVGCTVVFRLCFGLMGRTPFVSFWGVLDRLLIKIKIERETQEKTSIELEGTYKRRWEGTTRKLEREGKFVTLEYWCW